MSAQTDPLQLLSTAEVLALQGRSLGPTSWLAVEQDRVDAFARTVADWHGQTARPALPRCCSGTTT